MSSENNSKNDHNEAKILDHNYDGIQEYDYPLPTWWIGTFILTVAFSIGYYIYYQWGGGETLRTIYDKDMATLTALKEANAPKGFTFSEEKWNAVNAERLTHGKQVFIDNCVACHKEEGQGDVGPNLADEYWINGDGSHVAITEIIYKGVVENGMPVWSEILSETDIYDVAAYVKTLKGIKRSGAKEPQGKKI